jgi:hypothetical protein
MISHLYYPELKPKSFKLQIQAIKIPKVLRTTEEDFNYYNEDKNNDTHSYAFTVNPIKDLQYVEFTIKYTLNREKKTMSLQEGSSSFFHSNETFTDSEMKTILNKWYKYIPVNFLHCKFSNSHFQKRIIYEFDIPEMEKVSYNKNSNWPSFIDKKNMQNTNYFGSDSLIECIACASFDYYDEEKEVFSTSERTEEEEKEVVSTRERTEEEIEMGNKFTEWMKGIEKAKTCFCLESYGFFINLYYYEDIRMKPEFVFLLGLV